MPRRFIHGSDWVIWIKHHHRVVVYSSLQAQDKPKHLRKSVASRIPATLVSLFSKFYDWEITLHLNDGFDSCNPMYGVIILYFYHCGMHRAFINLSCQGRVVTSNCRTFQPSNIRYYVRVLFVH